MTTLARILCAIDLEKASERAFERALSLAIISKAKLHLLHATPANVPFARRAVNGFGISPNFASVQRLQA